jgi:hypothetical protein
MLIIAYLREGIARYYSVGVLGDVSGSGLDEPGIDECGSGYKTKLTGVVLARSRSNSIRSNASSVSTKQ